MTEGGGPELDPGRLRALLDRQEIQDVLTRYCRAADRCDAELMRSCYHDDAVDNHGMFDGAASAFVPYAQESLRTMICTQHFLTNVAIEVRGDAAVSDAYCLAFHRMPSRGGGLADHWVGLRFVDRMERRDGRWKIARRTIAYEWSRVDPVAREWSLAGYVRGARSGDDISYELLRELGAGR
ncbi:nuclear transport factor 2 family protein [Pseudofrankia inefficax]|uniref:Aromatic-ring-hydroxylating dioxygenase beta subunit n=1 Tax=Pseudofrankia inefficax (strain DSM 45817 / CECT 9037 / DDB 130130 / EuI1c) TaxID=298654 RepID=E3J931_PSEI1|nr:nuclear transport factor 2 family protein [Pseudofrankia inefficax]ADP80910.1 aromatic-ring-hydroxylating dioxygenase beta subunit [Pseudofrankia inefficax]